MTWHVSGAPAICTCGSFDAVLGGAESSFLKRSSIKMHSVEV